MSARDGRRAGVMLPLASLPGAFGVGDMGPQAYRFVDMLSDGRAGFWQILPLNPLGYGNSPYQPYSSFAGDPLYISLEALRDAGLLSELPGALPAGDRIDYEQARAYKEPWLQRAFAAFEADSAYEAFVAQPWVRTYAAFMTFKRQNDMAGWQEWPEVQRDWPLGDMPDLPDCAEAMRYEMFLQYMFYMQWKRLKDYANGLGIRVIGDIPIYVGVDSVDVWANRKNFLLDAAGYPTVVAGVPPDYFSATGQRWGNPIYDWAHLQGDGFAFWIERLRYSMRLFDVVRIDHFRAFDTYWEIPRDCPTAVDGVWKEAPGYALFDSVFAALPGIEIIAEDLGMLRDEVYVLRDHYGLKGMKIIQFTFDPKAEVAPGSARENMVVYTGTHDNQTVLGWYRGQGLGWRVRARLALRRAGYRGGMAHRFVRLALDDAAKYAVIPLPDLLGLGDAARMNTPGTVGSGNWSWKLTGFDGVEQALLRFAQDVVASGRG